VNKKVERNWQFCPKCIINMSTVKRLMGVIEIKLIALPDRLLRDQVVGEVMALPS